MARRQMRSMMHPMNFPNKSIRPRDLSYCNLQSLDVRVNDIITKNIPNGYDFKRVLLNKYYPGNNQQKLTLLLEATLAGRLDIVNMLITNYRVTVDKIGDIFFCDELIVGVTALWCACAIGNIDIVHFLVRNSANLDFVIEKKSFPVRNSVDIHTIHNSSCLMVACIRNQLQVTHYLLANGAEIDLQNNSGGTAMHYVVQDDNYKMAKILVSHNAMQLRDNQSLTPLLLAASKPNDFITNYLVNVLELTPRQVIDAEELLGASFMNHVPSKLNYGLYHQTDSMSRRKFSLLFKDDILEPVERYQNQVESRTLTEYENMRNNDEVKRFEGLIIRERVMGNKNPQLMQHIINLGADFERQWKFKPCLLLYKRGFEIATHNKLPIHDHVLRLTRINRKMMESNDVIELIDLSQMLHFSHNELLVIKAGLSDQHNKTFTENLYKSIIMSTLGLICLTAEVLSAKCHSDNPETLEDIMKVIKNINKHDFRTEENFSFLHLSLNHQTGIGNKFTSDICFPNYHAMKLLVDCGADVDALDNDNNTPLHYIGYFVANFPEMATEDQEKATRIVLELLDAGAHTDFVNKYGQSPYTGYLSDTLCLNGGKVRSLQCMSASVLAQLPNVYYSEKLPSSLSNFTDLH